MKFELNSLDDTKQMAKHVAKNIKAGDVIALYGDLGAGKTSFSRYLINILTKKDEEVLSPTFNLVFPYEADDFTIWHFDLYRLKDANEVEEIGLYEAFDYGVSIIEWPQIIEDQLPQNTIRIKIDFDNKTGARNAVVRHC